MRNIYLTKEEANKLGYEFKLLDDDTYELLSVLEGTKAASVPIIFNRKVVSKIGDEICQNQYYLEKVSIPSTIKTIGWMAFSNCINLKSLTIENGVIEIGDFAFSNCFSLENIDFPESLIKIGEGAFSHSSDFISIRFQTQFSQLDTKLSHSLPS